MTLAESVLNAAREKSIDIVTAESCTGGLLSACLTEISGASDVFERGFITYSNDAKMAQLSVERKTLLDFGAVSAETALEMADGALSSSFGDIAIAITGIAGPTSDSEIKPIGLVYIAVANRRMNDSRVEQYSFDGDRTAIRLSAVTAAMKLAKEEIEKVGEIQSPFGEVDLSFGG